MSGLPPDEPHPFHSLKQGIPSARGDDERLKTTAAKTASRFCRLERDFGRINRSV
jgi:hypothetical protein